GHAVAQRVVPGHDHVLAIGEAGEHFDATLRRESRADGTPDGRVVLDDEHRLRALTAEHRRHRYEQHVVARRQVERDAREETGPRDLRALRIEHDLDRDEPRGRIPDGEDAADATAQLAIG